MTVGVGDQAPDFTLPGTAGRSYSLAEFRGRPVVLVFYPGDNTPVCTKQLNAYTDDFTQFEDVGAEVLAISPQGVDILGPLGFYRRSVFVVDAEGRIRYAHRAIAGLTYRATDELVAAVKAAS